jgi:hypothetical protein
MLSRLLTGICAVAGTFAGAQFPAFYTQYLQHVSGRLTQVMRDLRPILQDAQARGMDVATYLGRAAAESGDYTRQMVRGDIRAYADLKNLEAAYTALSDAGPAMQPVAFARHVSLADAEIVLRHYTPSLPLSMEGMAYGGAGLLLGLFIAWVLESPLRVWHDMRRKRRQRQRRRVRQDPTLDTQARQTGTTA